jgi:hypothetical protein
MKEDLTQFSDSELSLRVMNDEVLYDMRRYSNLRTELEMFFIFTNEQWDKLVEDL